MISEAHRVDSTEEWAITQSFHDEFTISLGNTARMTLAGHFGKFT